MLYRQATRAKVPVSLATIYNTLHQFTEAGLLRKSPLMDQAYFDTNVRPITTFRRGADGVRHPAPTSSSARLIPPGYGIAQVDVVVRLRRRQSKPRIVTA